MARLIEKVYSDPHESGTIMPKGQVDSVLLVAAWFRKRPEEKAKCMKKVPGLAIQYRSGGV